MHQVGDTFYIRDASLDAKVPVCVHALPSLLHYAMMLRAGRVARVACPDPGPPLTNGGCAIFELELMGEQRTKAAHRYVER